MPSPSISPIDSTTSSSTQSTTSRITSSTSSKPPFARSSSYSHVFPSTQNLVNPVPGAPNPRGLSEDTKALARKLLQNQPQCPAIQGERTKLFSNGLQWLLDAATETEKNAGRPARHSTRVAPLTEDAVRKLDKHGRHSRIQEIRENESVASSTVDRARIDAWVSETDSVHRGIVAATNNITKS
ncbi:hypothetical protein AUEXF2481DRAFT_117596 [Aureobasidium subglaciale EXF-2481]|uniref:Uncharacterized protein n=1 Tax=Aureobasidium subglaciale (strain EXF-2481) TaxID=1043005 RepID=A0A074YR30_AURSE|nr:uncharacterized protein AUEXF2481DRAFT_117596 [Aureobasidium subglaciale EXF-2481]KER00111.1 hypothetical protein AUEXF2481DRAFT_117596 [Aureobasidium subglaciale EXF-2481]